MSASLFDKLFQDEQTKTSAVDSAVEGFDKHSEAERRGIQKGIRIGRDQMYKEFESGLDKISSELVHMHRTEEFQRKAELQKLSGEVAVHAMARELSRIKASCASGVCWGCGSDPHPQSPYLRCKSCDSAADVTY